MKVEASLKNVRITPRKVRMIAYSLRGVSVVEALVQLQKQVKKAALPLSKLLQSAVSNAENNFGLSADNLYVSDIVVGDGTRLKRWMPRAHGRATPIIRRMAHVRLILESTEEGTSAKKRKQTKKKTEESSEKNEASKKSSRTKSKSVTRSGAQKISRSQGVAAKKVFQRKSV